MKKGTIYYNDSGQMAMDILAQIVLELGLTNIRCFGYKQKWVVKYKKGKQDKFDSFNDMYSFLKNEGQP